MGLVIFLHLGTCNEGEKNGDLEGMEFVGERDGLIVEGKKDGKDVGQTLGDSTGKEEGTKER